MTVLFRPCNLCKSKDVICLFSMCGYPIIKCRLCGLVYTDIKFEDTFLKESYNEEYYLGGLQEGYSNYLLNGNTFKKNCRMWLREISKYKTTGSLLDVGCACGFFLDVARTAGWNVLGVEISEFAAKYARDTFNIDVINDNFLDVSLIEDSFDVITMWDVIEHLSDPLGAIAKVYNLLRNKGVFIILTGDVESALSKLMKTRWRLMTPPLHLYYFSEDTITATLRKNGFRILKVIRPGKFVSLNLFLYQLSGLYFPYSQKLIKVVLDRFNLNRLDFYINLKDEILVIAAKP